jgi:hypothetical protein
MAQVYKLISPSGKCYIGLTSSTVQKRFRQHVTLYKKLNRKGVDYKGNSATPILFYAFDKYPPESWEKEILIETEDLEYAKQQEIEYIATYQTTNQDYGYNILLGGQTGWAGKNLSEGHKKKQSTARKLWYDSEEGKVWKEKLKKRWANTENNPSTLRIGQPGWKHTEESKAKISAGNKGKLLGTTRTFSEEHCKNISKSKIGVLKSEEFKQKVSNKLKGHKSYETQRKAVTEANSLNWLVTTPDGQQLSITNLRQFCKDNKLSQGNLTTYGHTKGFKASKV